MKKNKLAKMLTLAGASAVVVAICGVGTLAAMGEWWQPELDPLKLPDEIAVLNQGKPISQDLPQDSSPAGRAVNALEQFVKETAPGGGFTNFEFVYRRPLASRCESLVPSIAKSTELRGSLGVVTVSFEVHGAGLGQRALDFDTLAAVGCGSTVNSSAERGNSGYTGANGQIRELRWMRGDLIVSVGSYDGDMPQEVIAWAKNLDRKLNELLTSQVCKDKKPKADDARRNYTQPDYEQYKAVRKVDPPAGMSAPPQTISMTDVPELPVPPLGSVTSKPTPPDRPSYPRAEALLTTRDSDGPGCGWAFTGMSKPMGDIKEISDQQKREMTQAQQDLATRWANWPGEVARWQQLQAQYVADKKAYEEWLDAEKDRERQERRLANTPTTTTTQPPVQTPPRPTTTTTTTTPTTTTTTPRNDNNSATTQPPGS